MKIVEIRERTFPIASPIRNAYIDFSKMTLSLVARGHRRDARRPARGRLRLQLQRPLRPGQLMRERFIPRVLEAIRRSLLTTRRQPRPAQVWARCSRTRSPAATASARWPSATIDMAVWDAVAKIAGKPLFQLAGGALRQRHAEPAGVRLPPRAATTTPAKDDEALKREMRGYLERGYSVVKMKIGGAALDEGPAADRIRARDPRPRAAPRGGCQRPLRPR
jgi:hypothetical protein